MFIIRQILCSTILKMNGGQRLQWFTKGFYSVKQDEQNIVLSDMRMGVECNYVFNFIVGSQTNIGIVTGSFEKYSNRPDLSQLGSIWDRIWDPSVSLAQDKNNGLCVSSKDYLLSDHNT